MTLMLLVSLCASAQHSLSVREPIENGQITFDRQSAAKGTKVTVICEPNPGYGLSSGIYYATKDKNGRFTNPQLADNTSSFHDDRANSHQTFSITMPDADVQVWGTFVFARTLVIHQTPNGKLVPEWGYQETPEDTVLHNVAGFPIKLNVNPSPLYELVGVDIENVHPSYCEKSSKAITITMPNDNDTVHVTPTFGKSICEVTTELDTTKIKIFVTNVAPKSREEIGFTLRSINGYIPADVSVTGCKSWWRVGKPKREDDGGWTVDYRIKVDLQNVHIKVRNQRVFSYDVKDNNNSIRVSTYIPEMIPDYPGVATAGQQVPVVFFMPESFSATFEAKGASATETPLVYHNALENSFADEGMKHWQESNDYVAKGGLYMRVGTESDGNNYWRTSVANSMSQTVELSGSSFPSAAKTNGNLKIAAIASINPRYAKTAKVSIQASGDQMTTTEWVVADKEKCEDGWETVFKTGEVSANAKALKFIVAGGSDDENRTNSYDGPQFDDLCLLLPTAANTVKDEDVLVFTMGTKDVTIEYATTGVQNMVSVVQQPHATVTLLNTTTGEQGDSIMMMKDDVISVIGEYDGEAAIYNMKCNRVLPDDGGSASEDNTEMEIDWDDWESIFSGTDGSDLDSSDPVVFSGNDEMDLVFDSLDVAARKVYYHLLVPDDVDYTVTPKVDRLKINVENYYGGNIEVSDTLANEGDTLVLIVRPNPGSRLKQIRTIPANILTLTEDSVDAASRGGRYTFTMPSIPSFTLVPEFSVPITTAEQFDSIHQQYGEFYLAKDINLGSKWAKDIWLYGDFDGKGHRITYGGLSSLFNSINEGASVRHLCVNANVKGVRDYLGGIASVNYGVIEDCEVSGVVNNKLKYSAAGGVAGRNMPDNGTGGVISRCHVICDAIGAPSAYGIARQEAGGTISGNVFSGRFLSRDGHVYMICNDKNKSTIADNYYVINESNTRGEICNGATAAQAADLVELVQETADYPVFTSSIRSRYDDGFIITLETDETVRQLDLSTAKAAAGTTVTGVVRVYGNKHLESITLSAVDGSDTQNCPFTDNHDNVYTFSFVMPSHDVNVTFQTQEGLFIYTAKQFINMNDVDGIFYLASDIDLYNWNRKVNLNGNFYGFGHTIRYHGEGDCVGLFNKIKGGALLEGLRVVGYAETNEDCGGIAYQNLGTIRDCHFNGRIKKLTKKPKRGRSTQVNDHVAAIACVVSKMGGLIDHCSATGELECESNQANVNQNLLCVNQADANVVNSHWVSPDDNAQYSNLLTTANSSRENYPVYAQGIIDKINPRIIVGTDTIRVENGQTLDRLTLVDGQPFSCTSDIQVNQVVYKRNAMTSLEPWVLPFDFDRIAGTGTFEYHPTLEDKKLPDILPGQTLTLSGAPASISYKANDPWMVKGEAAEYVFTNSAGPITIKATNNNRIKRFASISDRGSIYATYENIPATTAQDVLLYAWDADLQDMTLSGDVSTPDPIQPFRFYAQFYNNEYQNFVKYGQTTWSKQQSYSASRTAPMRLAAAVADGWQPVFLDPRQPQSITARMLDNYEVACLIDVTGEVVNKDADIPLNAVSLVYQIVDSRMELPTALPLLVRAKRSDAVPLVDEKTGAELDSIYEQALLSMYDEDYENIEAEELVSKVPHYWCASFDNRLDIWPLTSPEKYADLAEWDCMIFDDNYFEQSFCYVDADDSRTTAPMSYCITVLDANTFEPLPLMGNRVFVEFIQPAGESSGINEAADTAQKSKKRGGIFNLSGQRVDASYKGIVLQNGKKIYKR